MACYPRAVLDRFLRGHQWMHENRRRWVPVLVVIGALVVGREVLGATPQEVDIELPLGADHDRVTRVDVNYLEAGELVHHVSLRYPSGAPEAVRHSLDLAPGRYDVSVELEHEAGTTETREGTLEAPAEGRVRVSLREPT